ncbi:hypothetical protein MKW98_017792 [Papaver atlanticum]|uniref:Uncharacterized protein n=1 Tax=Papaver atlanticum TaxID=357466 RepID=A0AAD4TBW8_9MAGN|nr:hypothetical protein MKW98_017792 [Papaver atlanticum]
MKLFLQKIILFYFLLIILLCYHSSSELITSLPGQPINVSFKQHSGCIVTDAQQGRALFYYFVEANSVDPLSRPLTLWLNGGPGCSSLGFGAFMEHGPFQPDKNGFLINNKYSWNLESNMLYVESPIGVGFSYSNTSSNYILWNDTTTAEDNAKFIVNWLEEFPEFKDSDLYLTGESYCRDGIPVMLYSGDQDAKIPLTQTRIIANMLARNLNLTSFTKYAQWFHKKQVGGWAQSFGALKDGKNVTYLTYATVRGAAHEVPFTSPSQALALFKAFISGTPSYTSARD